MRFAFLIEPPFCFRTEQGTVTGCDVEVARVLAQRIGAGPFVPVETEFDQLLPGLCDGRWDMTTGLFITAERKTIADFSRPIWALPDGLLVRAEDLGRLTGYGALARASSACLGVVRDQVQHQTASDLGVPDERIRAFGTYGEAAVAVADGRIDATASVAMAHRGYLAQTGDPRLAVVEIPTAERPAERGAFAFAKSRSQLRDAIDAALEGYLGTAEHRRVMERFGFSSADIDLIAMPAG